MQTIETAGGARLRVDLRAENDKITCVLEHEQAVACVLHWGLLRGERTGWKTPSRRIWPAGSKPVLGALQTPFAQADGTARLTLQIDPAWGFAFLEFALFHPAGNRWDNNRGRNYRVALPVTAQPTLPPLQAARSMARAPELRHEIAHGLEEGYELAVVVGTSEQAADIVITTDLEGPLLLHWGIASCRRCQWSLPPSSEWPAGTTAFDAHAARTPFLDQDGLRHLRLTLPVGEQRALCFVLYQPDDERWWKNRGSNFYVPLRTGQATGPLQDPALAEIAEEIIEKEAGDNSWTLMHRFELAHNVLDRFPADNVQGLALVFVWLRFSAIRQLDWQRRFNTKPRELAHAQDRLTLKLSERYASADKTRPLLRLIVTTLGRGGEGQRVRDGILEIMHRHHIKEVSGHFLEEWHQKLHNNTTPDDVVIAEAYMAFLRANGDRDVFYATLNSGGVTRERLSSYERPIRSEPDFVPHLRDALLRDFDEFLGVLRAVHRATDLGTSIAAARPFLDGATHNLLDTMRRRHREPGAETWLLQSVTQVRATIQGQLHPGRPGLREWLYLDLALEDFLRVVVERNLQRDLAPADLRAWTELVLRNLMLSRPHDELDLGLRHLQRLPQLAGREEALHGQAVLERLRRALAAMVDADFRLLQPLADHLGHEVGAAEWSVRLFTEEVVRGRLEFVASALLRKLDASLRASAGLGSWQVVSRGRGHASGVTERQTSLAGVQGRVYATPTILILDEIRGDEDIPQGVTAILSRGTVDLVSHLAVRSRNAGVLLATCWEAGGLDGWGHHPDEWLHLRVTPAGEIAAELGEPERQAGASAPAQRKLVSRPAPGPWAVTASGFRDDLVGAKTLNLHGLQGRLPEWIHLPASVALPFGVCERTWEAPDNRTLLDEHRALLGRLSAAPAETLSDLLANLREQTTRLQPPPGLEPALRAAMSASGLPNPEPWPEIWRNITRVWGSKWNERAFFNRRANGLADHQLLMAVLIQEVVSADYAFVIHTANPATGDRDELYAELVPGLGEILVGNHAGRALGFAMRRNESAPRVLSFPSKSLGLYGQGLIFRSDSNGEDLAGFAGAGLYDSFMVPPAQPRPLDYAQDDLLWNSELRLRVLTGVAKLGFEIERILGGPQDIEGVYAQGRFFVVQTRPQVGLDHD